MEFFDNLSLSLSSLFLSFALSRPLCLPPTCRRAYSLSHSSLHSRARAHPLPNLSHRSFQELACKDAINGTEELDYWKHDCRMQHTRHHLVPHPCPQRPAHTPQSDTCTQIGGEGGGDKGLRAGGREPGKEGTMALRLAKRRRGDGGGGQMPERGRDDNKNDILWDLLNFAETLV